MRLSPRLAGRLMVAAGVLGLLGSLLGMVVARNLVREVTSTVDRSLLLTEQALGQVEDTLVLGQGLVDDVVVALADLEAATVRASGSLTTSADALEPIGPLLAEDVAGTVASVGGALDDLAGAADTVDDALRVLGDLPLVGDRAPTANLGEAAEEVAGQVEAIPGQLRQAGSSVAEVSEALRTTEQDLRVLSEDLQEVNRSLADAREQLDGYLATAGEAADLAGQSRDDLGSTVGLTNLLITLVGFSLALGQVVPLWFGSQLLGQSRNG